MGRQSARPESRLGYMISQLNEHSSVKKESHPEKTTLEDTNEIDASCGMEQTFCDLVSYLTNKIYIARVEVKKMC